MTRCALCGHGADLRRGVLASTRASAMLCVDIVACNRRRSDRAAGITRGDTIAHPSRGSSGPGPGYSKEQAAAQDLGDTAVSTTKPEGHAPVPGSLSMVDGLKLLYEVVTVVSEADPHGADDRAIGRDIRAELAGVTVAEVGHLVSLAVGDKLVSEALSSIGHGSDGAA